MRCYICDFCDNSEAKSMFNFSLIDPKGSKRRTVFVDKLTGKEICNYCYEPKEVK